MADTSQVKKDIREIVKHLAVEYKTQFHEGNILGEKDSRKFHGVSSDSKICLFVCTNELQDGKIKAGQRASIFEKCYWLNLSKCRRKILVFTDALFYNKFLEEYLDFLIDIEAIQYYL
jgi:hypothetical protein